MTGLGLQTDAVFALQSGFISVYRSHYRLPPRTQDEYLHVSDEERYSLMNYAEVLLKGLFLFSGVCWSL